MALSLHPASSSSIASVISSLRFGLLPNATGPGMSLHSGSDIRGPVHADRLSFSNPLRQAQLA